MYYTPKRQVEYSYNINCDNKNSLDHKSYGKHILNKNINNAKQYLNELIEILEPCKLAFIINKNEHNIFNFIPEEKLNKSTDLIKDLSKIISSYFTTDNFFMPKDYDECSFINFYFTRDVSNSLFLSMSLSYIKEKHDDFIFKYIMRCYFV